MVLGGEGYIDIKALANLMTDYTLFKAGDKLTRAKRKGVILAFAAFKSNIADKSLIINNSSIAQLRLGTLGSLSHTSIAVSHGIQFILNVSVRYLIALALNLQPLVLAQSDLRLNSNLGNKGVLGTVRIFQLHLGIGNRFQTGFLESLLVGIAVAGIDGVLIEIALAYHLVNDALGSLALTETGDIELGGILLKGSVQRLGILLTIYGNIQFVQVGVHFFGFIQFHLSCPPAKLDSSKSY